MELQFQDPYVQVSDMTCASALPRTSGSRRWVSCPSIVPCRGYTVPTRAGTVSRVACSRVADVEMEHDIVPFRSMMSSRLHRGGANPEETV